MVIDTLQKLSMTNNEIKIYITLLNLGESSVNDIGSKSGCTDKFAMML